MAKNSKLMLDVCRSESEQRKNIIYPIANQEFKSSTDDDVILSKLPLIQKILPTNLLLNRGVLNISNRNI